MKSLLHGYHLAVMSIPLDRNTTSLTVHNLVTVHRHSLGVPAQLTISRRADWSAATLSSRSAALLECQQLLGTEGLVVDLRCGLNQVLKVGTGQEVSEVDEFAVSLILDIDDAPSVLAAADLLASDNDRLLGTDNSEWDDVLHAILARSHGFCLSLLTLI